MDSHFHWKNLQPTWYNKYNISHHPHITLSQMDSLNAVSELSKKPICTSISSSTSILSIQWPIKTHLTINDKFFLYPI